MGKKEKTSKSQNLKRQLNLFDSVMIGMGIVIGSGIFMTTGFMAEKLPSSGFILIAWIGGGLITLAGALTYAELSAAMPLAGGQYVYIREAYGRFWAFLFGWVLMLVYWAGGIAALAAGFATFLGYLVPEAEAQVTVFSTSFFSLSMGQLVSVGLISVLSLANYLGVVIGKSIQNAITVIKIVALVSLIIWGLSASTTQSFVLEFSTGGMGLWKIMLGMGMSLVAVSWAFDGWNNLTIVAGEVTHPRKSLVRALVITTLAVTTLYVLINIVYLRALPLEAMMGVEDIATKATGALLGRSTASMIAGVILVSTAGSINGSILVGPRIFYAMAKDGLFFRKLGEINPRFRTPGNAIIAQGIWCSIIALSGTFSQIITFAMFSALAFGIAASFSVFTLRKKYPDMPRPYRVWGYPVIPIVFIAVSTAIMLATLIEQPIEALAGILITATGIPVYFIWARMTR